MPKGGQNRKAFGMRNAHTLYVIYRCRAKHAHLEFSILEEEFIVITQRQCYLCGKIPSNIITRDRSYGPYIYNGLSLIDYTFGYNTTNVVATCKACGFLLRSFAFINKTTNIQLCIDWIKGVSKNFELHSSSL